MPLWDQAGAWPSSGPWAGCPSSLPGSPGSTSGVHDVCSWGNCVTCGAWWARCDSVWRAHAQVSGHPHHHTWAAVSLTGSPAPAAPAYTRPTLTPPWPSPYAFAPRIFHDVTSWPLLAATASLFRAQITSPPFRILPRSDSAPAGTSPFWTPMVCVIYTELHSSYLLCQFLNLFQVYIWWYTLSQDK